jgi:2'-5' RNA ligase
MGIAVQNILKLIAIVLPEPVFSGIRKEQEYIAKNWGPKHALRTPPHITVIPPIALSSGEVGLLFGMAEAIAAAMSPFKMKLRNYGSFRPRVVFINPIISPELQELYEIWDQALRSKMPHVFDTYPIRPYHPHITLAHKDVSPEQFQRMWNFYSRKEYHASFDVSGFSILEHKDHGWKVENVYPFQT